MHLNFLHMMLILVNNLYWVVSNYDRIMMIQEQEIRKKARDIWNRYDVIFDQAWKEVKNSR